jgi:hypothetical protein
MRITSVGNVGIGTTSPQSKLQLNGEDGLTVTANDAAYVADYFGRIQSDYGTNALRLVSRAGDVFRATNYGQDVAILTGTSAAGTSERMRIDSSGNVGIGTTSPDYLLDVEGSVNNADIAIRINNTFDDNLATSNPTSVLWLNAVSNNGYLRVHGAPANTAAKHQIDLGSTAGSSFLTFSPGGAERMRIATDGKVGIGTTSPQGQLEVSGINPIIVLKDSGGATDKKYRYFQNNDNKLYFSRANDAFNSFSTDLVIDSAGNVGIGTTAPSSPLNIRSTGNRQIHLSDTSDSISQGLFLGYDSAGNVLSYIGSSYNSDVSRIDFRMKGLAEGDSKMSILGSGNVGIGTTSPVQKLHINNSTASSASYAKFSNAQTGTTTADGFDVGVNTGAQAIIWQRENSNLLFATNNTERIRITSGGNVGIGTTNPTFLLQVQGTPPVNNGALINARNSAATATNTTFGGIYFNSSPGNDFSIGKSNVNTVTTLSFRNGNNGVSLMDITPSGNVGIGTTSPAVQLELGDNTADEKLRLTGAASGKPLMTFYNTTTKIGQISSSSVGVTVTSLGSGNMTFENGGGARLVIDNSGNVGIADTSPSYKLDVDGTIRATGDVIAYSDIRVKENIKTIDNALEKVNKLRGVEFNKIGSEEKSIGVIAQEIEKVLPEVVKEDDKGMKSVAYGNIVGVLIEAIKDQQKQIDELKSIINGGTK